MASEQGTGGAAPTCRWLVVCAGRGVQIVGSNTPELPELRSGTAHGAGGCDRWTRAGQEEHGLPVQEQPCVGLTPPWDTRCWWELAGWDWSRGQGGVLLERLRCPSDKDMDETFLRQLGEGLVSSGAMLVLTGALNLPDSC